MGVTIGCVRIGMLFNSLEFLVFFPLVVLLYWILPQRFRNSFLLVASYYFYMNWEPVYAILIFVSSITTWGAAMFFGRKDMERRLSKVVFVLCLIFNLGILFLYKYADFVGGVVQSLLDNIGIGMSVPKFPYLLPVGISFYTFQAIGYAIDVYKGKIEREKSLWTYVLFISFFPQLVAGPIERAKNLLPQFHGRHRFNNLNLIIGARMMLWGYFMKLCVAENLSPYVNAVYNNLEHHTGASVWLATFFFTFQILCDFGGYSLIAIGAAKCMGFSLMQNFRQPYNAASIKDFWRRWHISLSTWFSDYLYIPLGGNRCSTVKHQRNLFLTFLVSGIWHGANWTFIAWGAYHGVLIVSNSLANKFIKHRVIWFSGGRIFGFMITFLLVMIGWVFFRANNINDAFSALSMMAHPLAPLYTGEGKAILLMCFLMIAILVGYSIIVEKYGEIHFRQNRLVYTMIDALLIVTILMFASFESGQFIYFQF